MAMHPQQFFLREWLVQHHIVWSREAPCVRHVEADPEHPAAVHRIRVGILEAEGGYACADAVQVFFALREMFGSGLEKWRGVLWGRREGCALGSPEAREDSLRCL